MKLLLPKQSRNQKGTAEKMKRMDSNYMKNTFLQAKAGDADAIGTLFTLTCDQVFDYAFCYVRDRYAAYDVLIRAYAAAIQEGRANTYSALLLQRAFDFSYESLEEWSLSRHPDMDDLDLEDLLNRMVKSGRSLYTLANAGRKKVLKKRRFQIPVLDLEAKEALIDQILDQLGIFSHRLPVRVLQANAAENGRHFGLQKFLLSAGILACLLLPVFMIGPRVRMERQEVSISDSSDATRPRFHVTTGFFPVKSVSASLNGKPEKIYTESDGSYALLPSSNGTLAFTASLWNGQSVTEKLALTDVDLAAPVLESYQVKGGKVHLFVTDAESGIDYASIYGEKQNKETIRPVSSFKDKGEIVFNAPPHQLTVYISDKNKNLLKVKILTD